MLELAVEGVDWHSRVLRPGLAEADVLCLPVAAIVWRSKALVAVLVPAHSVVPVLRVLKANNLYFAGLVGHTQQVGHPTVLLLTVPQNSVFVDVLPMPEVVTEQAAIVLLAAAATQHHQSDRYHTPPPTGSAAASFLPHQWPVRAPVVPSLFPPSVSLSRSAVL